MIKVPLLYFKTKCAFIDDNKSFIDELTPHLDGQTGYVENFADYDHLIAHVLNSDRNISNCIDYCLMEETDYEEHKIDFNLLEFKSNLVKLAQENIISVVFSDYSMPQINGLELFRKLECSYIKKSLLTGVANENEAIIAFNNNEIDSYINKSSINLVEDCRSAINSLKYDFFVSISNEFIGSKVIPKNLLTILNKTETAKWFKDFIKHEQITYLVLVCSNGTFYVENSRGESTYLQILYDENYEMLFDSIEWDELEYSVKLSILKKEKFPLFFENEKIFLPEAKKWRGYLCNVVHIDEGISLCMRS